MTPSVSRRDFLRTSAAATGGLVLGLHLPGSRLLGAGAPTAGSHAPNAWVRIGTDNTITLLCARSEMGQGVYTALPMLIAEELHVALKDIKVEIAPPGPDYVNAMLGADITGGSTSVRDGWEKLRVAGAQARMMLISAAASRWKVAPTACRAERGVVFGPSGKRATYGELAEAAASLPVPSANEVSLKAAKDFVLIGKPTPRLDTPLKVNGTAGFGIDVKLPGLVYASLAQCPVIGGKVKVVDDTPARAMPGVIDVVQIPDGVAVVATSYWRARKARETLKIEWSEGVGAKLDNAVMRESIRKAAESEKVLSIEKTGDVASALAGAATKFSADYESPLLAHATLEPMNFTADFKEGHCLLVGPTQFQTGAQASVAAALGIKPEAITVKTTFIGGGFGRRLDLDFIVQAAQLSKAVGRPVKLLWTREDDMTHDFYRPMALHRLSAGLDASGRPVALTFQMTSQSITQRLFGLPKDTLDAFMTEAAVGPYDIPATSHDLIIHDAGLRVGYWRSVSHALNAFANESFIDELAHVAGKDPYAFRMSLLGKQPRFTNVLRLAGEKAGWGKPAPAGRFRGLAVMEGYDSVIAQIVELSVKEGVIKVHRVVVAADLGQVINPDTVEAQVQGSFVFGLSAALYGDITLKNGRVEQGNFDTYQVVRIPEMPVVETILVKSNGKPGGFGEPVTALVAPALANGVFAATGKRIRKLPLTPEAILGTSV